MPSLTREIRFGSELHRRIASACRARIKASRTKHTDQEKKWDEAEKRAFAFLPEREIDALRRVEREGGKPQYTTIQLPYTYAVLLTAHTYWATVFMSRQPVHQYTGRHGEGQQAEMAVEAVIDYQSQVGMHLPKLFSWLFDSGKWGDGIIGVHWDEKMTRVSSIREVQDTFLGFPTGKTRKMRVIEDIKGYQGNSLYNVRPMDFFHDPRVTLRNFQDGEYCGVYISTNWNRLIEGKRAGRYTNLDVLQRMRDSHSGIGSEREIENQVLDMPDPTDFGTEHVDGKLAAASVTLYEVYIELIPEDWKLGKGDMPEKWVFTVTEDFKVVIGAAPMGSYHNMFPFIVQPTDFDPYNVFSRNLAEVISSVQNTLDWLVNTHFYNVRKTLNNQLVVDPSRIVMKDLKNPLPGGIIRVRPAVYGQDVRTAWGQLDIVDITRTHLSDTASMIQFGERIHGVNDSVMGLSDTRSRRSATEVRSSNTFSVSRLKTQAEFMSVSSWHPLAQMMLQNTQQYLDAEMQLKIVGDLALTSGTKFLNVTPDSIQGFYDYVTIDGTLPVDRFAQASLWRELLLGMRQLPQLMEQYDIGKIFAWVAQLTGLRNINQFRIQVVPDAQALAAAQAGNVVPLSGTTAPGETNPIPQPTQLRNLGQTI